jgi:hypothetical protein
MKKLLLATCFLLCSVFASNAYTINTIQDSIYVDTHWTCDQQYFLKGYVYLTAGHTLIIDSGVIIRGDKNTKGSLIVERGATIKIMGTLMHPVVFTSNQPAGARSYGDWGGLILCGNAPVNWTAGDAQVEGGPRSHYGGTDPHDNSGEIHYCRIEFAGIAFSPNNEINGLTLCGVGDGTQIDHVMVAYSGDDAIEWFGGTVNAKYLVTYSSWDDDFDTDNGFTGKVQFGAIIRDATSADQSGSKGFESDSYQSGTASGLAGDTTKTTKCVFSNITAIGPLVNPGVGSIDPQYVAGAHIRRGSGISILNSVIGGWPCGVLVDESSASYGSTVANIGFNIIQFRNNILAGTATYSTPNPKDIVFVKDGARSVTPTTANADTTSTGTDWSVLAGISGPVNFLYNPAFKNKVYPTLQNGVRLTAPFSATNPNLTPTSTSPICYNAAHTFNPNNPINYDTTGSYINYNVPVVPPDFTNSKASDGFFTPVNFVGAFSGNGSIAANWMNGWCNFDPLNENYDITCYIASSVPHIESATLNSMSVYPNPVSNFATISMDIATVGNVKITILDATGKLVKEVFNGKVSNTGAQAFSFNTNEMANGIYLVSVIADNKHKLVRFSVVK